MFSGLSSVRSQSDDDTSRSRVLRILDLLAHRAIARQAEAADLSEPQSLVRTQSEQGELSESESLTTSRSRTLTSRSKTPRQDRRRPESRRHRAFLADVHRVKSQLIVLEEKLTFTQDMLLATSECVSMMRPAVLKYYEDVSKIRSFEGLEDLRQNGESERDNER